MGNVLGEGTEWAGLAGQVLLQQSVPWHWVGAGCVTGVLPVSAVLSQISANLNLSQIFQLM